MAGRAHVGDARPLPGPSPGPRLSLRAAAPGGARCAPSLPHRLRAPAPPGWTLARAPARAADVTAGGHHRADGHGGGPGPAPHAPALRDGARDLAIAPRADAPRRPPGDGPGRAAARHRRRLGAVRPRAPPRADRRRVVARWRGPATDQHRRLAV